MHITPGGEPTANLQPWQAKDLLGRVLWDSNDAITVQDFAGRILAWNRGSELTYGYSEDEALGHNILEFIPDSKHDEIRNLAEQLRRGAAIASFETQRITKDGRILDIWMVVSGIMDDTGASQAIVTTERDITARKAGETALKRASDELELRIQSRTAELQKVNEDLFEKKELFQVTLASIGDAVVTTDVEGNITYLNPIAESLTGWRDSEAAGLQLPRVFRIISEMSREPAEDPVLKCLRDGEARGLANDTLLMSRDGREIPIDDTAAPIFNSSKKMIGAVLIFRDVTEKRRLVQQLSHQADHDSLTGLTNRREFERRLKRILASRDHGELHCLLYLDVDQFKIINDTSGHVAGDALLCRLSAILRSRIRSADMLGRLGGDEFAILLERCPTEQGVRIAEELLQAVRDLRFQWESKSFTIGVSIGVVPILRGNDSFSSLLIAADSACYIAKEQGRNRLHVYEVGGDAVMQRRSDMVSMSRISDALREDHFRLYYQPIMSLKHPEGKGYRGEILLRLLDGDQPMIPETFLPAAERYDQMAVIDRWVVRKTLHALGERRSDAQPAVYSINISGQSLGEEEFLTFVMEQFRHAEVPPTSVCFEITETAAIANLVHAIRFISSLRESGCQFALDDFGMGLSSFSYLRTLPVDYVKIAGSFVTGMVKDPVDRAMVEAINSIGHVMGIRTIAESVEDEATLEHLRSIGVDYAQGFGIAKPEPLGQYFSGESDES